MEPIRGTKKEGSMGKIRALKNEPIYTDRNGKEIEYLGLSLYDYFTLNLEKFKLFFDLLQTVDFERLRSPEQVADLGEIIYKEVLQEINSIYSFVSKEVGDVWIDSAKYNQEAVVIGGTLLGAYIKEKE
jgi:hypothetical protein